MTDSCNDDDPPWYDVYVDGFDGWILYNKGCISERIEWKREKIHSRNINDLPSIIWKDGGQEWLDDTEIYHRGNGLPAVVVPNERLFAWYTHGKRTGDNYNPPPGAIYPGQLTKPARSPHAT